MRTSRAAPAATLALVAGLGGLTLAACGPSSTPTAAPATAVPEATATATLTATPTVTPTVPTPTPTFTPTPPPEAFVPVLPSIDAAMKARLREVLRLGQERGMRPNVFAKVGDSITVSGFFLTDFGCGGGDLGAFAELRAVVDYFRAEPLPPWPSLARCAEHNSFTRRSIASGIGWTAVQVFVPFVSPEDRRATAEASGAPSGTLGVDIPSPTGEAPPGGGPDGGAETGDGTTDGQSGDAAAPDAAPDAEATPTATPTPDCPPPDDAPLRCELRLTRPGVALVMFGTNEAANRLPPAQFQANVDRIAGELMAAGVIPVLSTIPHRTDRESANARVSAYNVAVMDVAAARGVPLVNVWRALQGPDMARRGMEADGIHPNAVGYGAALTDRGLRYGHNQRNLAVLQTLDKLRRIVIDDGAPDG